MTPEGFLAGDREASELYEAVLQAVERVGDADIRVTKSQIAFRRRRTFAAVWIPGRYLRGQTAPLVLTVFLPIRDRSSRWKEVVEPTPGRFTHHLELRHAGEVDRQVRRWLRRAWDAAG